MESQLVGFENHLDATCWSLTRMHADAKCLKTEIIFLAFSNVSERCLLFIRKMFTPMVWLM
jgi:hypothetical protein